MFGSDDENNLYIRTQYIKIKGTTTSNYCGIESQR